MVPVDGRSEPQPPDHQGDEVFVAAAGTKTRPLVLLLRLGNEEDKHFHLDVVKEKYFGDWDLNPMKCSYKEIMRHIEPFVGARLQGFAYSRYSLPPSRLSESSLVRSTFFEVGKAGISFKITKSRIAIEGAPVSSVEWQLVRDGKVLLVDMSAWTEDEMNDEFLIRCFKKLDTGFRFFVLGEEDDGSES